MITLVEQCNKIADKLCENCKSKTISWPVVSEAVECLKMAAVCLGIFDEIAPMEVPSASEYKRVHAFIAEKKETPELQQAEHIRHKYGMYKNVLLSDEEMDKLREQFSDTEIRIDRLSEYIETHGKKYQSHYAVILSWAHKEQRQVTEAHKNNTASSFDTDEFFELAVQRSYKKYGER